MWTSPVDHADGDDGNHQRENRAKAQPEARTNFHVSDIHDVSS